MAYTLIEHQEQAVKNMVKDVMMSDTLVYYWMCRTIKKTELLKRWRTVIR